MAAAQNSLSLQKIFNDMQTRLEFGDVVALVYIVAFVRQYLWLIPGTVVPWLLTVILSVFCWGVYVTTKPSLRSRVGREFWLIVGLPLLAVYLLRVALPDVSFDVLNYRILHAERSLRGPLFNPSDFFPSAAPFNPAPDTVTGITRTILGYRLGTIINLLALLWAAQICERILRPIVTRRMIRSFCVLLIFLTEQVLFEPSTYLVDLLALPLLLEATYLSLKIDQTTDVRKVCPRIAMLLGASAAFKLTNLAAAVPIVVVCAYRSIPRLRSLGWTTLFGVVAGTVAAFVAPLLPFTIYIYKLTGNPLFPVANTFFKSPFWPTHGGWDNRWGPQGTWETIVWPALVYWRPERYSELSVNSGRVTLGFAVALIGLVLAWRNAAVRTVALITLTALLLWSAGSLGYSRYGLYQELMAGLTIVLVAATLFQRQSISSLTWQRLVAVLFGVGLIAQAAAACDFTLQNDWAGRSTVLSRPSAHFKGAQMFFRDRSLTDFLDAEQAAFFDSVPIWIESSIKTSGLEALLNGHAPIIAVRHPEYFYTRESKRRFIQTVNETPGQMFSLCFQEELPNAKQAITMRGLEIGQVRNIDLHFFSRRDVTRLMAIEVLRPTTAEAAAKFESSWMNAAFPDSDYREEITPLDAPDVMRPGEKKMIRFRVRNDGYSTWPAVGNKEGRYQVNIGDRWLDASGKVEINGLDGRTSLQSDLLPGAEVEMPLAVAAPSTNGEYILEVDMVHEGVTWFWERGAKPLRLRIKVSDQ